MGRERKGREGRAGTEGREREGGRERKGREGKGREGKGEGKGREGSGAPRFSLVPPPLPLGWLRPCF
jgi:hypothetical protein